MNSTDREEFDNQLRLLCAGFNVPIGDRSDAYWKGLSRMGLVEFTRSVETALGEEGPDRIPTTGQLWKILKDIRARRATLEGHTTPEPVWEGDAWDARANRLLVGYIGDQARAGVHYCSQHDRAGPVRRPPEWRADEESVAMTACLVDYKNAWARDMRELHAETGHITAKHQHSSFMDCMRRATGEAEEIRAHYARSRAA